jgi:hypothetical protein
MHQSPEPNIGNYRKLFYLQASLRARICASL